MTEFDPPGKGVLAFAEQNNEQGQTMDWKVIIGLFAKPIGAAINNAIAAASGAAIVWAGQHGIDQNLAVTVVGSVAFAISNVVSGFAATQGVQIPVINKDQTNGVVVVGYHDAQANSIQAVNAPKA